MKVLLFPLCLFVMLLPLGGADEAQAFKPFPDPRNISVVFETFSVPQAEAAAILRKAPTDAELYATCTTRIESKQAKQESLTVIRLLAGTAATGESALEYIYPTEYEPPERPNRVGSGMDNQDPQIPVSSPASPTSYQTRRLGQALEVQDGPFTGEKILSLQLFPERLRHRGNSTHGKEHSKIEMPDFESQSLGFIGDVPSGKPTLIGTFNRAPDKDDDKPRVWFAFVTARIIEP